MAVPRPIPKEVLKKMFLKVLHEHRRPGGRYRGVGWSYGGIIKESMCEFFGIEPLSDEEKSDAFRAVYELERDDYIRQDLTQSNQFKILSKKGLKVVERELQDIELPAFNIDEFFTRDDLLERVRDDYIEGDYELPFSRPLDSSKNPLGRRHTNRRIVLEWS